MDKTKEKESDFIYAVKSHEVLEEIIYSAEKINDPCDFGLTVANILLKNRLINEAIFEIVTAGGLENASDY